MCSHHFVRNYPEICCDESDDDEEDCIEACRKAPPYCVSRKGCFSTYTGFQLILITVCGAVLFIGAICIITFYLMTYDAGLKWRKYGPAESKENIACANMHAVMETLGFITLLGMSIVGFGISRCCDRAALRVTHIMVSLFAAIFVIIGFALAYEVKNVEKKQHFLSAHSWMGLIALILFAIEVIFGIFKFIILLAFGPISCCLRASCRPIHSAFGLGAYWAAIAAAVSGIVRSIMTKSEKTIQYQQLRFYLNQDNPVGDPSDDVLKKVDFANAFACVLLGCGILVTYAVISRQWGNY